MLQGNTSESFLRAAFQGRDVLSFQGMSWVSAPDAPPLIEEVIKVLNQDQGTKETVHWLLHDICPELVRGLLQTGKSALEKVGQNGFAYVSSSQQWLTETEQDPMVLVPHVLCLYFVCGKTLAKE